MDKKVNLCNYLSMFYRCLFDVNTGDLRKIETYSSLDGLYVKIHILVTYTAFVGVTFVYFLQMHGHENHQDLEEL